MTQYDYKATHDAFYDPVPKGLTSAEVNAFLVARIAAHSEVIRHALKVADKLMQEPSEEMIKAGWFSQYKAVGATDAEATALSEKRWETEKHISIPAFKAIRDKMLKEIE